jgi:hypothetical protein
MDRGIASAENVSWMYQNGYKYVAANREQLREFDNSQAAEIKTESARGF